MTEQQSSAVTADTDPLADLVARFSRALLAKLRLAQANGRSGWERDDWEAACQKGLLRHIEKGDPRDVAAYCAFMWHHGWITSAPAQRQLGCDITDAMCEAAIDADETVSNYIQGFSYNTRHVIRDVRMPWAEQEIWSAPIAGPDEYQAFQKRCQIERMHRVLAAALAFPSTDSPTPPEDSHG
jgi:hypothetical protein